MASLFQFSGCYSSPLLSDMQPQNKFLGGCMFLWVAMQH